MIGRRRWLLALAFNYPTLPMQRTDGVVQTLDSQCRSSAAAVPQDAGWRKIDILYGRPICESKEEW
jgi:hypothetical protein